jgi:hypothetical protein
LRWFEARLSALSSSLGLVVAACGGAQAVTERPAPPAAASSAHAEASRSAPPAETPRAAEKATPTPAELAALARDPAWDPPTDVQLHELGTPDRPLRVVMADFETTAKRADGMPVAFRRIALFDADTKLLAEQTIKKSEGGADLLETEQRDVDGDGALDLVFYYDAEDQWNLGELGWIAALARGALARMPLRVNLSDKRLLMGSACWAPVEQKLVQIVVWQESSLDDEGTRTVRGYRASATTVGLAGLEPVGLYGVKFASGPAASALAARVPEAHRMPELESALIVPDCSAKPPAFVVVPERNRWAMLTGLSLERARAGDDWPPSFARPARRDIVEIPKVDPSTWQTKPAPK